MNPLQTQNTVSPFSIAPKNTVSPFSIAPKNTVSPFSVAPKNTVSPFPNPVAQTPQYMTPAPVVATPQASVTTQKPLYVNGLTSDPAEMAKNRAILASYAPNLQPQSAVGFSLSNKNPEVDSSLINTNVTRNDLYTALSEKQSKLASGTDTSLQPTTGYQKFISDYSNAVKMSPEQIQAKQEVERTTNEINNIKRNLENRRLELTQNGALSPAQVEADMRQYTTEANSRIADLLQSNQQYTTIFNSLETQRKNTLDAYGIQAPFYKPTELSPGSQIIDPSTGQLITQGTGVSPSTILSTASSLEASAMQNGNVQRLPDGSVDHAYYQQQAQQLVRSTYGGGMTSQDQTQPQEFGLPQSIKSYVIQSNDGTAPYINADRVPANELNFVRNQAAQNGIPVLTAGDVNSLQSILYTQENLNKLEGVVSDVLSPGIIGRGFNIGKSVINDIFQNDPRLVAFNQARDTAIKSIQSLVAGSGSGFRLTQPEIDTATSNMPTSRDNLETAKQKILWVNNFLETKKNLVMTGTISKQSSNNSSPFVGDAWK